MATCAPDRIEAMAARVEASGRKFVDAPVSGGVAGAKGGTLTIMAAAPQATFDASRPLLEAMGSNLFYLGQKPGQGTAMKIVNQLLAGVNLAVAGEAMAFAERAGIDLKVAHELLTGSAAGSWMLKARGQRMIDYDNVVTSAVEIFVKDLGLVLDAGRALRMGLPIAAAAHQQYLAAAGIGLGKEDDSQVIEVYRTLGKKPKG
jgi:putative dehydrogenase